MDALDFLDDSYGICMAPPNSNRWTATFLLIGLLAFILIKKTGADLRQTRRDYLGADDDFE